MPKTKMQRITVSTVRNLKGLDLDKKTILENPVGAYTGDQFLLQANKEYANIKANPEQWSADLSERDVWDVTLLDGLEQD